MMMRSMSQDSSVTGQRLKPGTARRVLGYARPYRGRIALFLLIVVTGSALVVATPLILQRIVDDGILQQDRGLVVRLALLVAGVVLGFARALGDFGATMMIAGNIPGRTRTASIAIYDAMQSGDGAEANRLALWLTGIGFACLFALGSLSRRRR